ncbi:MAG: hypothetical protein LBG11_05850, partial [Bifidobacteriaceae bacterium]|nr:hypothetical protein [Bifidobacteriaceae bacterium]
VARLFVRHGERIAATGLDYPAHEVNFEQSIVAPAALVLLELHHLTGQARWLDAALPHVELLDRFEGCQPEYHLNGVAIRHWDGYWFGKDELWGDTFPHYWSTLNALAWGLMAHATGDPAWQRRATTTMRANLTQFGTDGTATAAFVYPMTVNGREAHRPDPYANDQDWTLVFHHDLREWAAPSYF